MPLHSLMEPSWTVPRDENMECSLFVLEEQEKEYNARLEKIANVAAPEPIGTKPGAVSGGTGAVYLNASRLTSLSSNRPRSIRRHRRSSTSATPTRRNNSHQEYRPASSAASTSRTSLYRRFAATGGEIAASPIASNSREMSRWESSPSPSSLRRDSMNSLDDTEMG